MRWGICFWLRCLGLALAMLLLPTCSSKPSLSKKDRSSAGSDYGATASLGGMFTPSLPKKSPSTLYREANVKKAYIKNGTYARKYHRKLRPKYITIHSTQNYSPSADAWRHSKALNNGKLRARKSKKYNRIGYLTWHYSVDQYRCVQHLPCNEQAEHADFNGPGNNYSLAIEMCENRGNSRSITLDRTAKLTAWLMYKYKIPLRKVVPHYHWRRKGLSVEHKNCPNFLMDNGHPGAKWQAYLAKINKYYKSITSGSPSVIPKPSTSTSVATTIPRPTSSSSSSRATASRLSSSSPRASSLPKGVTRTGSKSRSTTVSTRSKSSSSKRSGTRYHTVRSGDTLYGLSRKYKVSVTSIQRANKLSGTVIRDGKKLRIPAS